MKTYTAELYPVGEVTIEADNLGEAMDTAVWEHGHDAFIVAVYETDATHEGEWILSDAHGFTGNTYPTKEQAIANNDVACEILIAIPKRMEGLA